MTLVEQTIADLVRVSDSLDEVTNPKAAAFASHLKSQLTQLQQQHEPSVIVFFNEPVSAVLEMPKLEAFPLPVSEADRAKASGEH